MGNSLCFPMTDPWKNGIFTYMKTLPINQKYPNVGKYTTIHGFYFWLIVRVFLLGKYFITIHGSGMGFGNSVPTWKGGTQPDLLRGRSNDHRGY